MGICHSRIRVVEGFAAFGREGGGGDSSGMGFALEKLAGGRMRVEFGS